MRILAGALWGVSVVLSAPLEGAPAGETDFSYIVDQVVGSPGGQVEITVTLVADVGEIQGWSVGICNTNPEVAVPIEATIEGTPVETAKAGARPDFYKTKFTDEGITQGVVVDFGMTGEMIKIGPFALEDEFVLLRATFRISPDAQPTDCTQLVQCDTLGEEGTPPVIPVVVVDGVSIPPNGPLRQDGSVCVPEAKGEVLYFDAERYEVPEGTTEVTAGVLMDTLHEITGFSFGVTHDPDLLALREIREGADLLAANGGEGPQFFEVDVAPDPGPGGTVGAFLSMSPPFDALGPGVGFHLVDFVYDIQAGSEPGSVSPLAFSGELAYLPDPGVYLVEIVLDASGTSLTPEDGQVGLGTARVIYGAVPGGAPFVRGDVTEDGRLTISDGVRMARALFGVGPALRCHDAADANDDERLDAADALYLLNHLFLGGPDLAPPAGSCGPDETGGAGGLGCDAHDFCGA